MDILERFNDDEVYYADREYLSNSSLKLMKESPTKFSLWHKGKWLQPNTSAFDVVVQVLIVQEQNFCRGHW